MAHNFSHKCIVKIIGAVNIEIVLWTSCMPYCNDRNEWRFLVNLDMTLCPVVCNFFGQLSAVGCL